MSSISHSRLRVLAAAPVVAFLVAGASANALADSTSGCATLAAEPVTLDGAAAIPQRTGAVPLKAGDILSLRMTAMSADAGAGSVTLIESNEAEGVVLSGAAPREATFTVPLDGLYGFEYRADGPAQLRFEIVCAAQSQSVSATPSATPEAFVERRASQLLSDDTAQASLRRLDAKPKTLDQAVKSTAVVGEDGQPQQVSVSTSLQSLAAAKGQVFAEKKLDAWIEGRATQFQQQFDENNQRYSAAGSAGTFNLGADYLLNPGVMVGALLQLDQYRESYDELNSAMNSQGLMFGPYASVRLAPDLVFDARAAWGNTGNIGTLPEGTRVSFDTNRELLRGQLSGKRKLFGLDFTPNVALAMVDDHFADPSRMPVGSIDDGATVVGRVGVGSGVSYRIALEDGAFLQPNAALSTGWTFDRLDMKPFDTALTNDAGAKAEAGLTLGTADGINIQATGAVEGIGKPDYSAWSGRVSLTAPLN